jgi:predicted ATP-grasp superfamily ATP-dependent carboligase
MTGETVLIASFSARALAQSARRAGFIPLVVDAFGDLDTRAAADDFRIVEDAAAQGFRTKPLMAALESLSATASSPPLGLVLGSGFEDKTRLIAALASRFRLLGCDADTIRACNDPETLSATCDQLGITTPEMRRAPPDAQESGWLSKRVGGSGGRHIRVYRGHERARPRRYFQRHIEGARLSIGGVFSDSGARILATRQWTAPSASQPFRYGGAVSTLDLDPGLFGLLTAAATAAANALNIVGMASFDFVVVNDVPHLVDINPRPGAALDVLDDEDGYAFNAHILACNGSYVPPARRREKNARAAAVLHADRGDISVGNISWPEWSADRPSSGTHIPHGSPLATAFATADTSYAAEKLVRSRLAELESLIYGPQ